MPPGLGDALEFDLVFQGVDHVSSVLQGIGEALAGVVTRTADFQTSLNQLQSNSTLTASDMDQVRHSVLALNAQSGAPLDQLTKSFMLVSDTGFTVADTTKIVQAAMESALPTGADLADVAGVLSLQMHDFGIQAGMANNAVNVLHLASALSRTTMQDFADSTAKATTMAANLGIPLVNVDAALASLTLHMGSASAANTALAGFFSKLVAPAKGTEAALASLGTAARVDLVNDFTAAGLRARGLPAVMADLEKATHGNVSEMLKLVPAMRGGLAEMVLLGTGAGDNKRIIDALTAAYAGQTNATLPAYRQYLHSLNGEMSVLQAGVQQFGMTVGQPILTALMPDLSMLLTYLTTNQPAITAFGTALGTDIGGGIETVVTAITTHRTEIEAFVKTFGTDLTSGVKTLVTDLPTIASDFGQLAAELPALVTTFTSLATAIGQVGTALDPVATLLNSQYNAASSTPGGTPVLGGLFTFNPHTGVPGAVGAGASDLGSAVQGLLGGPGTASAASIPPPGAPPTVGPSGAAGSSAPFLPPPGTPVSLLPPVGVPSQGPALSGAPASTLPPGTGTVPLSPINPVSGQPSGAAPAQLPVLTPFTPTAGRTAQAPLPAPHVAGTPYVNPATGHPYAAPVGTTVVPQAAGPALAATGTLSSTTTISTLTTMTHLPAPTPTQVPPAAHVPFTPFVNPATGQPYGPPSGETATPTNPLTGQPITPPPSLSPALVPPPWLTRQPDATTIPLGPGAPNADTAYGPYRPPPRGSEPYGVPLGPRVPGADMAYGPARPMDHVPLSPLNPVTFQPYSTIPTHAPFLTPFSGAPLDPATGKPVTLPFLPTIGDQPLSPLDPVTGKPYVLPSHPLPFLTPFSGATGRVTPPKPDPGFAAWQQQQKAEQAAANAALAAQIAQVTQTQAAATLKDAQQRLQIDQLQNASQATLMADVNRIMTDFKNPALGNTPTAIQLQYLTLLKSINQNAVSATGQAKEQFALDQLNGATTVVLQKDITAILASMTKDGATALDLAYTRKVDENQIQSPTPPPVAKTPPNPLATFRLPPEAGYGQALISLGSAQQANLSEQVRQLLATQASDHAIIANLTAQLAAMKENNATAKEGTQHAAATATHTKRLADAATRPASSLAQTLRAGGVALHAR